MAEISKETVGGFNKFSGKTLLPKYFINFEQLYACTATTAVTTAEMKS